MDKSKKDWLLTGITLAVLAIVAVSIYLVVFYQADELVIENGKVQGASSTWLISDTRWEGQEKVYRKVAVINPPKGYVNNKQAEDPDGDPVTTFFAFEGKDPAKNPGQLYITGVSVNDVPADALEIKPEGGLARIFEREVGWTSGWVSYPRAEEGQLTMCSWLESPYEGTLIEVKAAVPEEAGEDALLDLLVAAAVKVTPEKKLSPLAADFKANFIDDARWSYLWTGLLTTLLITLGAVILGIVIGVLVAAIRSSWDLNRETMRPSFGKVMLGIGNGICKVYLTVIRGTPVVIQLMIMYYIIFASSRNGTLIAILAFGINSGAYVAEIIRSGIMSVDRGQFEAGRSIGFNYAGTMWKIIIPQALKNVLPALANEFIVLLKETSVSGYVAVRDLTKGGDIIRSVTYSAFLPLIAVALIYLVLVMFFTWLVGKLERRLRSSDH